MKHTTIAVDLAKSVFQVAISHRPGRVAEQHRLSRSRLLPFFAQQPPSVVVLEACGSAHHWARQFRALGHTPVLLPAHAVHRYLQGNKTDQADTKALLEAFRNEQILPVPVKSVDQQALAALHRLRSAALATRTARLNTLRGILREFGLLIPLGARNVLPALREWNSDTDSQIPPSLRPALEQAACEIADIEERIHSLERQLHALARQSPAVARLLTVPGIGWLTASALVAFVGSVHRFPSARHFASYIGLTPREHSSGAVRRLGRISKRGDTYLRMLLVHGARSVLWTAKSNQRPDRLRAWALHIESRRGHNKAAVAVANKLARIAWVVWKKEQNFEEVPIAA